MSNRDIIELANIIAERPCDSEDCALCIRMGRRCNDYLKAERAIKAGYCKQSEVAIEIFAEIENLLDKYYDEDERAYYPVPHYDLWLGDDIAELKKKYTEPDPPKGE